MPAARWEQRRCAARRQHDCARSLSERERVRVRRSFVKPDCSRCAASAGLDCLEQCAKQLGRLSERLHGCGARRSSHRPGAVVHCTPGIEIGRPQGAQRRYEPEGADLNIACQRDRACKGTCGLSLARRASGILMAGLYNRRCSSIGMSCCSERKWMDTRYRHSEATRRSRYYNGPVSDHFDGTRFYDPAGAPPRSRADLLRWQIGSRWRGMRATAMWAMRAGSFRRPGSICCSTRSGRGAHRRSGWSGRGG